MRAVLLLCFAVACCSKPVVKPEPPAQVLVQPCLAKPPPARVVVTSAAPCPEGWVCLDTANAGTLDEQLRALRSYAEEAWNRCR